MSLYKNISYLTRISIILSFLGTLLNIRYALINLIVNNSFIFMIFVCMCFVAFIISLFGIKNDNSKRNLIIIIFDCVILCISISLIILAALQQTNQNRSCSVNFGCMPNILDLFGFIAPGMLILILLTLINSIASVSLKKKKVKNNVEQHKITQTNNKQNNITASQKIPVKYKMKFVDYFFISYVVICVVLYSCNIATVDSIKQIFNTIIDIMPNNFPSELLVILIFALIPAFISAFIITKIKNKTKK